MIDTHCHLEQTDYDNDRDSVIQRCRQQLQAIITTCAHPQYFPLTMEIIRQYAGFVFASASIHPLYVKEITENDIRKYFKLIRSNKDNIVAIGETGLDYNWIKENEWRKKQHQLFLRSISLAKELQLPMVIHSRDATGNVIELLEEQNVKAVQMHMFTTQSLLNKVIDNGWLISVNTLLLRSKNVKKIVRNCPLEQLMLETDSPWLGIDKEGNIKPKDEVRNDPSAIKIVAKRIAMIKGLDFNDVTIETTKNAIHFFGLKLARS